ncbi:MAG: hypothetical protein VZQ82_00780 [Lachnospiraceae bacterium]|nr:hypothetical protein [Lachnospiraceae bacterium]
MKLKALLENEKNRIMSVPKAERAGYILTYYWLWIAGVAGAVIFAVYLIHNAFFTPKENWFYALFVNVIETDGTVEELREGFISYAGYDTSEKNVVINANSYFDASKTGGTNNNYFQAFAALVESGDLDAVVTSEANLIAVGEAGRLLDLSAEPYGELFAGWKDLFVYCIPYDEEYSKDPVPVGIDISGSDLYKTYGLYPEGAVLGIGAYTKHPEEVVRFLTFLNVGPQGGKE